MRENLLEVALDAHFHHSHTLDPFDSNRVHWRALELLRFATRPGAPCSVRVRVDHEVDLLRHAEVLRTVRDHEVDLLRHAEVLRTVRIILHPLL